MKSTAYQSYWIQGHRVKLSSDPQICPTSFSLLLASSLQVDPGATVIDVGCGGGIQSIVAAKRGAVKVYAVDIRTQCVEATRIAARMNGVSRKIVSKQGTMLNSFSDESSDLVISNPPTMPKSVVTPVFTWGGENSPTEVLESLISESSRVLKPGGSLQFIVSSIIPVEWVRRKLSETGFSMTIMQQHMLPFRKFYHSVYTSRTILDLVDRGDLIEDGYGDFSEVLSICRCLKQH